MTSHGALGPLECRAFTADPVDAVNRDSPITGGQGSRAGPGRALVPMFQSSGKKDAVHPPAEHWS